MSEKRKGNAVIGQSGGPTMVINQSLVGVIQEVQKHAHIERLLGARHGVRGIIDNDFIDIKNTPAELAERIALTPSAALGSTRFMDIALEHRRLEIGATWLTPAAQRTGANVETKLLLLSHAFDTMGVQRVVLKTEALNTQSRTAILALGAVEEGTFRRHLIAEDGRMRDMTYFSILHAEWPLVRECLRARLARYGRPHDDGSVDARRDVPDR
jgi:RimJ/RimL family protein N-acetyltransferase